MSSTALSVARIRTTSQPSMERNPGWDAHPEVSRLGGMVARSPCPGVKIKPELKREHLILTPEQVGILVNAAREP
jgi:hypothetical protein